MTTPGAADPAPRLSVVVPTLEEERALPLLLGDLRGLEVPHEVVVSDGGSRDGTVEVALAAGAAVVAGPPGRGPQIRAGVEAARAPWLLLLHADCRFPARARRALEAWLAEAAPDEAAHFRFELAAEGAFWRLMEAGQRLRERLTGLAYGDQGLVLSRRAWNAVGGAPAWPVMEDVGLVDRLRRHGRVRALGAALPTSVRRWEEEGRLRAWLRNTLLVGLFRLGVPPAKLAEAYPPPGGREPSGPEGTLAAPLRGGPAPVEGATVVVFARAPRPGRVKTRLAAEVGDDAAARAYRAMGRGVVDRLRGGPWRLEVAFTPADAAAEMRAWLGDGVIYRAQLGNDLGERMERALAATLAVRPRACVVGSDIPELGRPRVEEALAALEDHDLVVGPTDDGGYHLLALRAVAASLFRDVPWGTDRVLSLTLSRARALGLVVRLLTPLRDVDTAADLEALEGGLRGLLGDLAGPHGSV